MSKRLAFLLISLVGFSWAWSAPVPLVNADFETNWSDSAVAPPGWTRSSCRASAFSTPCIDLEPLGLQGHAAGLVLPKTSPSHTCYLFQDVPAAENTRYTLSGQFLDKGPGKARLYVEFYRAGTRIGTSVWSPYTANSTAVQTRTRAFTSPAGTTRLRISIRVYQDRIGSGAQVAVDHIALACVDTTAPVVSSITFPGNRGGNRIGGKVRFTASASDNVAVARVEFYKGTALVGTDIDSPYECIVDFNGDAAGTNLVIRATAYDGDHNTSHREITVNKPGNNLGRPGATLIENGGFFRVWAPHAAEVQIAGDFNDLYGNGALGVHTLTEGADHYWFGFVPGAAPGHRYKYAILNSGGPDNLQGRHWRLDPLGKDSDHSFNGGSDAERTSLSYNASIVVDPKYPWAPFASPEKNGYIIYQLHIGSFAGMNDGIDMSGHGDGGKVARFGDIETKLQCIKDMGFTAIELLPVCEFSGDRSWGYNIALYNTPEGAYGSPAQLRRFVDEAHRKGLAVIFDLVWNHDGPQDSSLYEFDGYTKDGGIYREGGWDTSWGRGPAWWKQEVQDFFFENARLFIEEYKADGLRFDHTTSMDGMKLKEVLWRIRSGYPHVYTIAEHGDGSPWITSTGNFDATWSGRVHHEFQRACNGQDPVDKLEGILGWDGYAHSWNIIKYLTGCHDDIGDQGNGNAEEGLTNWDKRHRYFSDLFGGRGSWDARAKCRLGWALNAAMPGTPMLFMGTEWHLNPPWGYWHDGSDANGDHRIDWATAFDSTGNPMRALVSAANAMRMQNPALRSDTLSITQKDIGNRILAFKRWLPGGQNVVLTIVNLGDKNWLEGENGRYEISTDGQSGQWTQILCSQDAAFGGWDGAGNAFHEPTTQPNGKIAINLPKWSVVVFRLKE
jgi:1,4-alpha-glucan branching enzyme